MQQKKNLQHVGGGMHWSQFAPLQLSRHKHWPGALQYPPMEWQPLAQIATKQTQKLKAISTYCYFRIP